MADDPPAVRYRPAEDESLVAAIVSAVSAATGRDVSTRRPVLYETVDPDALEAPFRRGVGAARLEVTFRTHGATVAVFGAGDPTIEVRLPPEG